MRLVRIGIDVGGTFTDAVALDDETFELLGQIKVETTHGSPDGVAAGIVQALGELLRSLALAPEQVRFIAHGTTQATNALLEGDVAQVGVLGTGEGAEGRRARSETQIGDLELAPGKKLTVLHAFVERGDIEAGVAALRSGGAHVIVAASPFSVDDPSGEQAIMGVAEAAGLLATGTHEITKLYGLRVRTRTAVVNASILPRMMETADMTEASVRQTGIPAPLMIMRCDGGVMTIGEVRHRPILTILSGPAAGVAGALMYEKISHGIFLEVGGTSTDLSAIRDGRVMIEYAEVGGHQTYLRSLDVRTVGVAGGSMIRLGDGALRDVGPRSAHIAGLRYATYAAPTEIVSPMLETFAPRPGDPPDYVSIRCTSGERFALTTSCAANVLGYAGADSYARGSAEAGRLAFQPLADRLGVTVEEAARSVLTLAAKKVSPVVEALLAHYGMEREQTVLVGGGGGAAAIVPFLAKAMHMTGRLAHNHQVISPIGVALALVREVVERTIPAPQEEDILRVRKEAEEAAIRSGAAEASIEIHVEVDAVRNLVRATATGATELKARERMARKLPEPEIRALAAASMGCPEAVLIAYTETWYVYEGRLEQKRLFGLLRHTRKIHRVLNADGVIRLSKQEMRTTESQVSKWKTTLEQALRDGTHYGDSGATLPETFVLCGGRLIDLSALQSAEQMVSLASTELAGYPAEEPVLILTMRR